MQKHTKVYMQFFDYGEQDFIPCEYCGNRAVDIHHLDSRGMGGSKNKDNIENLIALCRAHHLKAESNQMFNQSLKILHTKKIKKKDGKQILF